MGGFAINVREYQLSRDGHELRMHASNHARALRLIGRVVVLYRPRDENAPGYYGVCLLANVDRDYQNPNWLWVGLGPITHFPKPVPLEEIYRGELTNDTPFHTYARALRPISTYEFDRLLDRQDVQKSVGFHEETWSGQPIAADKLRWTTRKVLLRKRLVRDQLLSAYGPACALSQKLYRSLNGHSVETQVGHLVALEYGGPDIVQNALPMSGAANWHWDNGLISLTDGGQLLVSPLASGDTHELFEVGRRIKFPDSRVWPKAEYLDWHRTYIFEKGRQPGLNWKDTTQR